MSDDRKLNSAIWVAIISGIFALCGTVVAVIGAPLVQDTLSRNQYTATSQPTSTIGIETAVAQLMTSSAIAPNTPEPESIATPTVPQLTDTQTPTVILPTITSAPTSTFTPIPTPTFGLQSVSIKGKVLDIDLPNWVTNPVRGSITFNSNVEIANTGKLTVHLSVRNELRTQWKESDPELVLALNSGEQFCSITPAEFNTVEYWLGFQAHCASTDACSYNIEGNHLWVTIGNVEVTIAPQGVQCPNR